MTNYIINRDDKKRKIIHQKEPTIAYKMKPKLKKRNNMIEVKEIIIVNPTFKEKLCKVHFNILFRRLTQIVLSVINDNDTEDSDAIIALDDLQKAKTLLVDEYAQILSKEETKKLLKRLKMLEKQLRDYIIKLNINKEILAKMNINIEEEKGLGR